MRWIYTSQIVFLTMVLGGCQGMDYSLHDNCVETSLFGHVFMTCPTPMVHSQAFEMCASYEGELVQEPSDRDEAVTQGVAVEMTGEELLWSGWPESPCPVVGITGSASPRDECDIELRFLCEVPND